MPVAFFQVRLSVRPEGGSAALVPPTVVRDLGYQVVAVKEGGGEGIIRLEEPETVLRKVASHRDCTRLTPKSREELQQSYPPPKLKQRYREPAAGAEAAESGAEGGQPVPAAAGEPVLETVQTVRSGFYLIDVPLWRATDDQTDDAPADTEGAAAARPARRKRGT